MPKRIQIPDGGWADYWEPGEWQAEVAARMRRLAQQLVEQEASEQRFENELDALLAEQESAPKARHEEPTAEIVIDPGPETPPPKKPRGTAPAQSRFMRRRLREYPDDKRPPTEEEDLAAAKDYFEEGSFSREDFRAVRENETPPEWRTQGRRKTWGEIKKAIKKATNGRRFPWEITA